KFLALGGGGRPVCLCDVEGKEVRRFPGPPGGSPVGLRFSPDGAALAVSYSGDPKGEVRLLDVKTAKGLWSSPTTPGGARDLAFPPDAGHPRSGPLLAIADEGIGLWEASSGKLLRRWGTEPGAGRGLAFSPDGGLLAAAGGDGVISLFRTETGAAVRHLGG